MNNQQQQQKQNNNNTRKNRRRRNRRSGRNIVAEEEVLLARMANLLRRNNRQPVVSLGDVPRKNARAPAPNNKDLGPALDLEINRISRRLRPTPRGKLAFMQPENLGRTPESGLWVLKYLHPCSEFVSDIPRGIPDDTTTSVVTFERRVQLSISAPVPGHKWGMIIINTPFPEFPIMGRRFDETTGSSTSQGIYGEFGDSRTAGWGFIAPTGVVDGYNIQPDPLVNTSYAIASVPNQGKIYSKQRTMYKGVTVTMDANFANNGGWLTTTNAGIGVNHNVSDEIVFFNGDHNNVASWGDPALNKSFAQKIVAIELPRQLDENTLMGQGIGVEGKPARDGVYVQSKFREPMAALPFREVADGYPDQDSSNKQFLPPLEGYMMVVGSQLNSDAERWVNVRGATVNGGDYQGWGNVTGNSNSMYFTSEPSYVQPSVTIIRNLDPAASLNIKSIEGVEAQLNLANNVTAALHAHASPCPDDYAMKLATEVSQRISGLYDARDNSAGEIIGKIAGVVADVSAFLSTFLPGPYKTAAMGVSGFASAVKSFL